MINLHDIPKEKVVSPYEWWRDCTVSFDVSLSEEWRRYMAQVNNQYYILNNTFTTTTNTVGNLYRYLDGTV